MRWLSYVILFFSIYQFECCQDSSAEEQCQTLQLQVSSHMNQADSQASASPSRTTCGSYVTASTEGTNSGEWQAATATTAYDINGAQQHHQQEQLALANFQLPRYQNTRIQVNQNCVCQWNNNCLVGGSVAGMCPRFSLDRAYGSSSAVTGAYGGFAVDPSAGRQDTANYFECSEIAMSHSFPNQTEANGVPSTRNRQHIPPISPIQTVRVHTGDHINIQLQQDPHKRQSVIHYAAVSTPNTHSPVSESGSLSLSIASTSTSTESQSSSELNSPLKMGRNCDSKNKPYICDYEDCTKGFTTRSNLRVHIRSHTGEKPYACDWTFCGKKFLRKDHLNRHQSIHSEEKMFLCEICGERFKHAEYLAKHKKKTHPF